MQNFILTKHVSYKSYTPLNQDPKRESQPTYTITFIDRYTNK